MGKPYTKTYYVSAEGEVCSRLDGDPRTDTFAWVEDPHKFIEEKLAEGFVDSGIKPHVSYWGLAGRKRFVIAIISKVIGDC
jgi:hypothetical protein